MSDERCAVCRQPIPTWYDPECPDVCWESVCRRTCRDQHRHFVDDEEWDGEGS